MTTQPVLVVFGAMGDLSTRLLLPALAKLLAHEPHRALTLVGAGLDEVSPQEWSAHITEVFDSSPSECASRVAENSRYERVDLSDAQAVSHFLASISGDPVVLYFAVPPAVTATVCEALTADELPPGTILALEKPFGVDQASAQKLNQTLLSLVPEEQVFRVDHFLGRATLLHILGLRFANRMFQPVWDAEHIESVDIRYDETLALEGRAGYYDKAGALVDMIQSHLLQMLAVIAMEPPSTLDEVDVRSATAAALRATRVHDNDPERFSRRARYVAGTVDGHEVPSYVDEAGVTPSRNTETLAEVTFEVLTERWAGVPFTLRSGKALSPMAKEITITFRPVRHLPAGFSGPSNGAVLKFTVNPDEIELQLNINGGTDLFALERETLHAAFHEDELPPYADVLSCILDREPVLSVRSDAAEECWRIVDPIVSAWRENRVAMDEYAAGSDGPTDW